MKTLFRAGLFLLLPVCSFAQQQPLHEVLLEMYEMENYKGAIERAMEAEVLDRPSQYMLGMCYAANNDDLLAVETFGKLVATDSLHAGAWYHRGRCLLFLGYPREAVVDLRRAYQLIPDDCDYTAGLADAFRAAEKPDSALVYYRRALRLESCLEDLHLALGETFESLEQPDSALKAYYTGFRGLSRQSEYYRETIYRIGVLEYLQGNLLRAEAIFLKGMHEFPGEIPFMSKLIQVYYALEYYEKAAFLKERIYGAFSRGEINEATQEEGFCIDQFAWKDQRIFVFEHFPPAEEGPFDKFVFYVTDENGSVCNQIHVEHRPSYLQKAYFYGLSMTNQKGHVTLPQYQLQEDVAYPELKELVVRILRKH